MQRKRIALALVLASLFAHAARGQDAAADERILEQRVEQIRDDPAFNIGGTHIAAKRLVPDLYARRGFRTAWTPQAREALQRAVADSAADGLDPEDYLQTQLARTCGAAGAPGASRDVQIDCDLLLSDSLTRLLYQLAFGKVDPQSLDPNWNFTRNLHVEDPAAFVQEIIDSGDVYARIEREKPQHRMYVDLKAALARERALAEKGGFPRIPAGPTLRAGMRDARVTALRARLAASGALAAEETHDASDYDAALEAAVKVFQSTHGLDPDGAVGAGTLAALNAPIEAEIETIRVNLERGRWLLHELDPTFVVVNIAGFEAYYLRDGKILWSARAQVGKPFRATPIFRSEITYLVLNPTWTVPPSILAQDILPAQRRDRSTLARKKLEVIDHSGRPVPEASIDWATATPRNFRYMLRQGPGPDNALGRVKFMFPNAHSVYLHDTPSQALFEKSGRAFSSGCIRVERPFELAALLLEKNPGWDRAAIDAAVAEGQTKSITLAEPVPVLLAYWTAWVDRAGVLQIRPDIYERDAKIAAGLDGDVKLRARPR
jgi:murein L,D-transpeptidase YcbB/YkuD